MPTGQWSPESSARFSLRCPPDGRLRTESRGSRQVSLDAAATGLGSHPLAVSVAATAAYGHVYTERALRLRRSPGTQSPHTFDTTPARSGTDPRPWSTIEEFDCCRVEFVLVVEDCAVAGVSGREFDFHCCAKALGSGPDFAHARGGSAIRRRAANCRGDSPYQRRQARV